VTKVILSLFDYTGEWPRPYKEAGYHVIQIDIKHGIDILSDDKYHVLDGLPKNSRVVGIMMAPPCTDFAGSGARWWPEKDANGTTVASVQLVREGLKTVIFYKPDWWVLENPVGRLPKLVPELGQPTMYFQPCDFGDPYTKKTGLWGTFNIPKKNPVKPTEGSKMWRRYGGKSERTKELRSITPAGFAKAFYRANSMSC